MKKIKLNNDITVILEKVELNKIEPQQIKEEFCNDEENYILNIKGKIEIIKKTKKEDVGKLGFKCQREEKEKIIQNFNFEYKLYNAEMQVAKFLKKRRSLNKIIPYCLEIKYQDYVIYNYANLEKIKEDFPTTFDYWYVGKKDITPSELKNGIYAKDLYTIKYVNFNGVQFKEKLEEEFKNELEKELKKLKIKMINIYEKIHIFFETELSKKIPTKFVGSFNNNEINFLYNLEKPHWKVGEDKITFQKYYLSNNFNLLYFIKPSSDCKNICELEEKDVMTPVEFLANRENFDIDSSHSNSYLAMEELYKLAEEEVNKKYKEDIEILKKLFQ
jgi:hypothetical protein